MGLIDKIIRLGRKGRELALAGVLGSLAFSGCVGAKPGPLHPSKLLFEGTIFNRDDGQEKDNWVQPPNQPAYIEIPYIKVPVESQPPSKMSYLFACNKFLGDANKNGYIDIDELPQIKNRFDTEGPITFVLIVNHPNRYGDITGGVWDIENKDYVKLFKATKNSDYLSASVHYPPGTFKPGKYRINLEFGEERIAVIDNIEIIGK